MSLSLWSPFAEQFCCLDSNSADTILRRTLEVAESLTIIAPPQCTHFSSASLTTLYNSLLPLLISLHAQDTACLHWLWLLELNLQMTGSWHLLLRHLHNLPTISWTRLLRGEPRYRQEGLGPPAIRIAFAWDLLLHNTQNKARECCKINV